MKSIHAEGSKTLRLALRSNTLFSTGSGLLFTLGCEPMSAFLGGIPAKEVAIVGIQLMLFAGGLVWLASREIPAARLVWGVIVADGLWVLGTFAVLPTGLLSLSGQIFAVGVAGVVAALGFWQFRGLRRQQGVVAA